MLVVVDELEVVLIRKVVVEPDGWKPPDVLSRILEVVVEPVVVALSGDSAGECAILMNGGVNQVEALSDLGIDRAGESFVRGKLQHVHLPHDSVRVGVAEDSIS